MENETEPEAIVDAAEPIWPPVNWDPNVPELLPMLISHLELQHATFDGIDNKAISMFTIALTIFGLYVGSVGVNGEPLAAWQWLAVVAAGIGFLSAAVMAWVIYQPRKFRFGPDAPALWEQVDSARAPYAWAQALVRDIAGNHQDLRAKRQWFRPMVMVIAAEAFIVGGAIIAGLA